MTHTLSRRVVRLALARRVLPGADPCHWVGPFFAPRSRSRPGTMPGMVIVRIMSQLVDVQGRRWHAPGNDSFTKLLNELQHRNEEERITGEDLQADYLPDRDLASAEAMIRRFGDGEVLHADPQEHVEGRVY